MNDFWICVLSTVAVIIGLCFVAVSRALSIQEAQILEMRQNAALLRETLSLQNETLDRIKELRGLHEAKH